MGILDAVQHVIAYRATLDVPREVVWSVAKLLAAERRRRGTPRGAGADLLLAGGAGGCGCEAPAENPGDRLRRRGSVRRTVREEATPTMPEIRGRIE